MATTEERLAALEAKLAALTATTPTEYYTHQYSGEEIDAAVGRAVSGGALDTSVSNVSNQLGTFVRPNLLDNWYFGLPVNQRGKTSYSADWIYTIDRWQVSQNTTLTVNNGSVSSIGEYSFEPLEEIVDALRGRTVTISLLFAYGELEFATGVVPTTWGGWDNFALSGHVGLQGIGEDSKRLWFMINGNAENILAVKLELGPTQTLAHREGDRWILNEVPDYGEQLRRCQRYFVYFSKFTAVSGRAANTNSCQFMVPIPVTLRDKPVISDTNVTNWRVQDAAGKYITITGIHAYPAGVQPSYITIFVDSAAAFTTGAIYTLTRTDAAGPVSLSADL